MAKKTKKNQGDDTNTTQLDPKVEALREEADESQQHSTKSKEIPLEKGEDEMREQSNQGDVSSKTPNPKPKTEDLIHIVIPYRHASAKGDELIYALRAWQKFFPLSRIVIIGDIHPKLDQNSIEYIPFKETSKNPQINTAAKMLAIIESKVVPDYFIWSNDDIYPVTTLTISEIDLITAEGPLKARGSDGGLFRKNSARTVAALKKEGITDGFDYVTHTPVGFWKDKLRDVIKKFGADKEGHLIATLYFNYVWNGHRPVIIDNGVNPNHKGTQSYVACVFNGKVSDRKLEQAFSERKFINHNDAGYEKVLPFLKKLFPKKSSFEK